MRTPKVAACLALLLSLGACSEAPQPNAAGANRDPAAQGTGSNFVAPGWKPGDTVSWNEQLRKRAQHGQDEYARTATR
jgi:hypothetical protein